MNSYVLIGVLGSVASIVSFLLAAPTKKSRIIHTIYGFLLTIVIGSSLIYNQNIDKELAAFQFRENQLNQEIEQLQSINYGARKILKSREDSSLINLGENRGFTLSAFVFFEKYRKQYPETYAIAKEYIVDGMQITKLARSEPCDESSDELKRMFDGAETMKALLKGIAGE